MIIQLKKKKKKKKQYKDRLHLFRRADATCTLCEGQGAGNLVSLKALTCKQLEVNRRNELVLFA